MNRPLAITLAFTLSVAGGLRAQQRPPAAAAQPIYVVDGVPLEQGVQGPGRPGTPPGTPADPLARFLFPPELVMQQQEAIGLKADQRTAITQAIKDFQGKVLDLQWQMQGEAHHLADLLDKTVVDQAAALAQVDKLLGVEREVKRAHMSLLIQIKNQLTAAQQEKLAAARAGS